MNTERFTRPISLLPKGTILSRTLAALALNKGKAYAAAEYAHNNWGQQTPEVAWILRSAVEAGDTSTAGWASQLAASTAGQELLALLDSVSVFNRLAPSMQQLPFRQPTPIEITPFAAAWVSEAGAVPVSRMTLASSNATLEHYKMGTIIVFTNDLARFSSPGSEKTFRDRFANSIAKVTDSQFLDPAIAAISGKRPASVTNGGVSVTSTGSTAAAVLANLTSMLAGLTSWGAPRWILPTSTAVYLSTLMTAGGAIQFPQITATGGTLLGVPVLTTTNISGFIVLLDAAAILFAREPIAIDGSTEASLEMDTEPAEGESSPIGSISVLVSLYQSNKVALKALLPLNYQRGHSTATVHMTVSY